MKSLLLVVSLLFLNLSNAQNLKGVGKVLVVKGDAFIKGKANPLVLGATISDGDTLVTHASTLLKIRFLDNTLVSLGPNSIFKINKFQIKDSKRTTLYSFIKGKIRAHVKVKRKEGETISFSNAEVAFAVRGTEILANSYIVQGVPSTDVMLTKGVVNMNLSKLGTPVKNYSLGPGKAFNSNLVRQKGIGSVKSISSKSLQLIASSDEFLPSLQNIDGSFFNVDDSISKAHGITPKKKTIKEDLKRPLSKVKKALPKLKTAKSTVVGLITGGFAYVLKNEPWDIRDAVVNREKNKKQNKCFYYFYKSIPGSGEFERFRRTRDCDEFEND